MPISSRPASATPTPAKPTSTPSTASCTGAGPTDVAFRQITSFLIGDYLEHHLHRPGRPPPGRAQQEAAPGGAAPFLRQPAALSRHRHQPRRLRPRPQARRPRGKDARLRQGAGQASPQVDRHGQHRRPARQDPAHGAHLHRRPRRRRRQAQDRRLLLGRQPMVVSFRRERRQGPPGAGPRTTSRSR